MRRHFLIIFVTLLALAMHPACGGGGGGNIPGEEPSEQSTITVLLLGDPGDIYAKMLLTISLYRGMGANRELVYYKDIADTKPVSQQTSEVPIVLTSIASGERDPYLFEAGEYTIRWFEKNRDDFSDGWRQWEMPASVSPGDNLILLDDSLGIRVN